MASSSSAKQEKEEQNKQLVRQFFELLDRHDTDRIGQLLVSSTNYTFHVGGMSSAWIGMNTNDYSLVSPTHFQTFTMKS
jgi:ketosteroid isomerase-like protein